MGKGKGNGTGTGTGHCVCARMCGRVKWRLPFESPAHKLIDHDRVILLSIEHWTLSIEHWALSIEHWVLSIEPMAGKRIQTEKLSSGCHYCFRVECRLSTANINLLKRQIIPQSLLLVIKLWPHKKKEEKKEAVTKHVTSGSQWLLTSLRLKMVARILQLPH